LVVVVDSISFQLPITQLPVSAAGSAGALGFRSLAPLSEQRASRAASGGGGGRWRGHLVDEVVGALEQRVQLGGLTRESACWRCRHA